MSMMDSQTPTREYATRPKDERFANLAELISHAGEEKNLSLERTYNLKDLHAISSDGVVKLESPKGVGRFTHWSFGQLSRTIGAPAGYLRTLSPDIAAQAMNFGLQESPTGSSANLLVRAPNGHPEPIIRAATSESYGRLWDVELYSAMDKAIFANDSNWSLPPTWGGEPAGANRGDRDSFLVYTNGGSIVNDPSAPAGKGEMFRGLLVRNSEVGASAVVIESILLRAICGNHLLFGAIMDKQFKRKHFGNNVLRDTIREISRIAHNWVNESASRDESLVKLMIEHELAHSKEAVVDELRKIGFGKDEAERSYELCVQKENASPRSYWGLTQGATWMAQEANYNDERYSADKLAGQIMNLAIKKLGSRVAV